jgi:ABC-type transport system involved in cytochrome c biogenesis permease subunit
MAATAVAFALYLFGFSWRPLVYAGFLAQSGYLLYRGLSLGRLPLVGVHDTLNFLSASVAAFALAVHFSSRQGRAYFMMLAGMAAAFTAAAMFQAPHSRPLPPVLDTYWFELHVALSFFSYALFGIAAMLGVLYLREREGETEKLQYRVIFLGYGIFSLSMIFGGVWAHLAWGTWWLWTPKELWTVLLWLFYSLYLHVRYIGRWAGGPSAALGTAGFGVVMFTYLGVGLLMKSSHAF